MKYKTRSLFWLKVLTAIWLAASVFAYSADAFYVDYIAPDKQQHAINTGNTQTHWDILNGSNDTVSQHIECYWCIINVGLLLIDRLESQGLNPPDTQEYSCLHQANSLISYQYFHSALHV